MKDGKIVLLKERQVIKLGQYSRKLKKGVRWYFQGMHNNQRYCSKAIYLTKQEAKREEREFLNREDEKARNPNAAMTLIELVEARLDYLQEKKSNFYYKENRRYFKKLLDKFGHNISIDQIKKKDINELLVQEAKRLKKTGKTNYKLNSMIRSLKALFNYAINIFDQDIKNPVVGIELYPIDINLKYIPKDEEIEAVKAICNQKQKFLIEFIDETAARISECLRLKVEDIDGDLITLWTRKAKNSNLTPRRIPKPECLKDFKGKGRVFDEWEEYPRFLEEKVKRLGQKPWNFHNFRHRRASIWANSGMTTLEIMHRLGHENLSTTMKYLQLLGFTRY